ncbi:SGNH/GDSL hydrolase family protein [Nocardia otitidiscaviarum]|uniref:SGNH/GDSL hydrolase family protein n=1 Tax=Nocardia otitidiscaviarum TaxID=1823 RepID=A0A516NKM2_9NOCA|nr:SGNH/GDSL hydrolase family protein [Nocardia otitidiscaviarum]MBF6180519.1 SGNH/GDSL hydrolase family protein [Nocardia otitidiscaviarum]MCP9623631.1 SGNH/GDSL hydrolase family protein [Nocardia otitidiscaviarum]QDP79451.1 SGNH/GDSL hydrolase family protein [Nocardia otitidiscaviarum]
MDRTLHAPTPFTRFVALGDSQTEGIGDPDGMGGFRGWADRFAALLAASTPDVHYANLAVRGRLAARIRAEQLAPALALRPDLATVMAGMNDLVRPSFAMDATLADIEAMITALRAVGAHVVTFTYPDIGAITPIARPLSGRIRAMNAAVRTLAARHAVTLVDFEPVAATTHRRVWAEDRLHLSPLGHDLVARALADTLRLPGADSTWRDPLPPEQRGIDALLAAEFRWTAYHFAPWVARRLRGRSSGDVVTAKRPTLTPVHPHPPAAQRAETLDAQH